MKIALLGDLHGNMPAVQAMDAYLQAQQVDAIYCLGDIIGKGPSNAEAFDWAMARCDVVLVGNWDELLWKVSPLSEMLAWYSAQLGPERLRRLSALPYEHRFVFSGRRFRLVHGRPFVDEALASDSPLKERMRLFDTGDDYRPQVVCFADVHRPFYQHMAAGVLCNTGSVGNPLAMQPYASCLILEGEPGANEAPLTYTIVQLPYDREEAVRQALRAEGMPLRDAYIKEVRTGRYSR